MAERRPTSTVPEAPEAPAVSGRKRAVPASRARPAAAAPKKPAVARKPRAAVVIEDEPELPNYALRLTEDLSDEAPPVARRRSPSPSADDNDTFALQLSKALEAISAAQATAATESEEPAPPPAKSGIGGWLAALDKLPPIRLPIGPAIPWRVGLPLLAALVIVMGVVSHSAGQSEPQGVQLPSASQQPTALPTQAPLFADSGATPVPTAASDATNPQVQPQQPVGVQDPGFGFDFMDLGIKLVAVLGLAYASMMLLKRFGVGGSSSATGGRSGETVRVVSSIVLAPNRSVHVIRVADRKTLLVGATPNSVNLLADLGELDHPES